MNGSQAACAPDPALDPVLDRALALVEFLRAHCSWDAQQTPQSLRRYLLEEAHEVLHAISTENDAALCSELGDLLLNLAFQVVLAEERAAFSRAEVVAALEDKMRRRHPHLYGGAPRPWGQIKADERAAHAAAHGASLLDDLPSGLDPLLHAHTVQRRVASVGFDWPNAEEALAKVHEEASEVAGELASRGSALEEEVGDLLFAVINVARLAGVDASSALAGANAKFERRFRLLEQLARSRGVDIPGSSLEQLDVLWEQAKQQVGRPPSSAHGRNHSDG